MIMQVQKYPLTVKYRPGKVLLIADTLSRAFLPDVATDPSDEEIEVNMVHVGRVIYES